MRLESQVCSLELAKRLKELGVRQESKFYWGLLPPTELIPHTEWEIFYTTSVVLKKYCNADNNSAFTVAELGEMFPVRTEAGGLIRVIDSHRNTDGEWSINFREIDVITNKKRSLNCEKESTEADARAKMLVYLIEKGIVNL